MDDSVKSGSRLEVSVSFGRFENDALSWEKWSSFSPNKYLEEVGSLSTPGSVAQKKAYFEAHYKKIAARKAEEMVQEQLTSPAFPIPHISTKEDHIVKSPENGVKSNLSSDERLVEVVEEDCITALTGVAIADEEKDSSAKSSNDNEHEACRNGMVENVGAGETGFDVDSQTSAVKEATVVMNTNVDDSELNASKDAFLAGLETPQKDSQRILKEPPESKNGLKQSSVLKKEKPKLNSRNMTQKVTPINKERNLSGARKKVVSSPAKPLPASTPRNSKPTTISTPISAPQSLKKKVNNSAPPKIKSPEVVQSKRIAPTSLHMSLSLGPADSVAALPMTRKSLIMESMGDKDIVKRAFKSFFNRTNGFATNEKPTTVSAASCEPKMSNYHAPTKGNEGLRKDAEKRATQRSQTGTRSNPLSSGLDFALPSHVSKCPCKVWFQGAFGSTIRNHYRLHKSTVLDKKTPTTLSPATGLRSDEKAEKRKELVKKLGAKSIAREAEKAQHGAGAKSKVGVENEIRQQRRTFNQ